ncbi:hypothetical protein ACFL59_11325 [Planctomycetota bacterium]
MISCDGAVPARPSVDLSNGGTTVLLSCLQLTGGGLAESRWERAFMSWLADKDQTYVGHGCVGFDLRDLLWDKEQFLAQKEFLLRVVDTALGEEVWKRLSYDPPHARTYLEQLRELVAPLSWSMVEGGGPTRRWPWPADDWTPPRCDKDGVIESDTYGCPVCNHAASFLD